MKEPNTVTISRDILVQVLRGEGPFDGWMDDDEAIIASALCPYIIGALDALDWVLDVKVERPSREEKEEWDHFRYPADFGDLIEKIHYHAGEMGYDLRESNTDIDNNGDPV